MKYLLNLILIFPFFCNAQSITNQSANIQYPRNITPYAIINTKTGDTLSWFWNEQEVKNYVQGFSYATNTILDSRLPMTIYTYSTTPLYHISAPVYSLCVDKADTSWFIKIVGTDSAGWFKAR